MLKINFLNGEVCKYERTFLVIKNDGDKIHLLNISSVEGKEWKLGFRSNKNIFMYHPPFAKKSFAKVDELYIIPNDTWVESKMLCNNRCMNPKQLSEIINYHNEYREKNNEMIKEYTIDELINMNRDMQLN